MSRDEATAVVDALFASWYDAMVRYASRLTGSVHEAEEVVQQAFLELFEQLCSGAAIDNPRAWTFCIIRRGAGRRIERHLRREVSLDDPDLLESMPAPSGCMDSDLERMLSVLTRREVEVVMLRLESMKYREIASALGISTSSVNALLARALRKLQAFVGRAGRRAEVVSRWEAHDSEALQ